ncbi:MAG: cyclic nucleotide-binding domain-containing protein [Chloroflexi bacterium]|nr:cyclic nucleotide-binding domain-containing protein [Chloroflexota bacterium]
MDALDSLRLHPWFSKLTLEQFAALMALAKRQVFAPGTNLARQGDLGNRFFVIERGAVNLRHTDAGGFETTVGVLPSPTPADANAAPKNYFGEQMFTTQEPYENHADALTETVAFVMTRQDFEKFKPENPEILAALTFIAEAEKKRTHGFKWVLEGEIVERVIRKHWWALVPKIAPIVLVTVVLVIGDVIAETFLKVDLLDWALRFLVIGSVVWIAWVTYDWYNDEYVLTNQRILHVERVMIIQESSKSVALDKVQNVRLDLALPSQWLGVGSLVVQTASGGDGDITLTMVGNATQIRGLILSLKDRIRARQMADEREKFRQRIRQELRQYIAPGTNENAAPATVAQKQKRTMAQSVRAGIRSALSLEVDEGSRIVWRKHWFVLFKSTARYFFALIGLDLLFILIANSPTLLILGAGGFLFGGTVLFGIVLGALVWNWIDWRNDIYAVNDSIIVDEERLPFNLKTKSNAAPLDQIQDIRVDIPSPVAAILNYGTVIIQTAGKGEPLTFDWIHNPRHAQAEIFRRIEAARTRRTEQEASVRSRSIVDAMLAYHTLTQETSSRATPAAEPPASDASAPAPPPPAPHSPDNPGDFNA